MIKNAFYFTLKALFVLNIFFCLDFLVMWKSESNRTVRLISNFMTSRTGEQTIVVHILLNISRNKGNETMKFGLLIETFFLKNHSHVVVKLFHDPFLNDQTWTYLWINGLKVFIVCQVKGYLKTMKISHRSLAFT